MSKCQRKINIFGATGSIGKSTADVILAHAGLFDIQVVSANENVGELARIAVELDAKMAVIANEVLYSDLQEALVGSSVEVLAGRDALIDAACVQADISMMAIVGMAGLEPMMKALEYSSQVAIANKESLVAAGPLVMAKAKACGTVILPVDSEHNAIFQVFEEKNRESIERLILTASGGPFRSWPLDRISKAGREDALAHPNWDMGAKISIDSATMMNKALEVIEARYLFDMPANKIDVIVHPQSIIHSMVEYSDGSVLAQMGASDMRTPIANILCFDNRLKTPGKSLNFNDIKALTFEGVDHEKFPSIKMAYAALENDLSYSIIMNAANEVAVEAFLSNKIYFGDIMKSIDHMLHSVNSRNVNDLCAIIELDHETRMKTAEYLAQPDKKTVSV